MIKGIVLATAIVATSQADHLAFNTLGADIGLSFARFDHEVASGKYLCDGESYRFRSSREDIAISSASGSFALKKTSFGLDLTAKNGLDNARDQATTKLTITENFANTNKQIAAVTQLLESEFGHCTVELFLRFGQIGIVGKENPSVEPLMHLGKLIFQHGTKAEPKEWDVSTLQRHLEASNENIRALKNLRAVDARKLLNCPTNEWFRLGDGRCDSQFNNADCNYDNGDCCRSTCKNYRAAWGALSPEDDDNRRHPVYDCSTATASTCRAPCNPGVEGYPCVSGSEGMCFRANYCGNEYFGMCGADDSCVSSLCGDCYCHFECQDHDQYCSCDGLFTFGCLNVFRGWCD